KGKITSAIAKATVGEVTPDRDEATPLGEAPAGADKSVRVPLKHAIERMSKSKGNGVDPNDMVDIYGADAARLFVMFAAPIENELVWNEAGIEGAVRFLQSVWRLMHKWESSLKDTPSTGQPGESS